ncbi:MAG: XRE family transcriptional regulator [Thermodesulfobacteriota bacterium]
MPDEIGPRLKILREGRRLTLKQLADQVGCTGAHLSQIENGHTSPSIATLKKIAQALGVNIVDFFADEAIGEPVVTREADRRDVFLSNWSARIQQLVGSTEGKLMQPFCTVVSPGGGSHDPYSHVGEEFGIVLRGTLTVTVGETSYEVGPRESFYYSSRIPHRWVNRGSEDVEVVWVVSPPTW